MATNISKVYLLTVPLEDDMKNTLYFANASAQQSYFQSVIGKTYTNVSYQSETRTFRCRDEIDSIRQYNYIMWQNPAFSNKWFYGFITKMEFASTGMTDVYFDVDPLQTYMFDITVNASFVEREHTNNDAVGSNTLDENVALGEFIFNGGAVDFGGTYNNKDGEESYICLGVTELIGPLKDNNPLNNNTPYYSGIFSGLKYMFFTNFDAVNKIIEYYIANKTQDVIQTIFYVPKFYLDNSTVRTQAYTIEKDGQTSYVLISWVEPSMNPRYTSASFSRPSTINGYSPRNAKLLTYPYNFFTVTNNNGAEYEYRYEDFNGNPNFQVASSLSPSMCIKATPTNHKSGNTNNSWGEGIMGGKTPQCSWVTDYYTNWLTQNAVNIGIEAGLGIAGAGVNLATGNPVGAGLSLVGTVGNIIAEHHRASMVADQVHGNINSGDISFSKNKLCFTYLPKSIKSEYARIIDDYFDMFGYQTNRVKVPNKNHRLNWWFTKTVNANITGDVPNDMMNKIKEAYNSGLTFWKNPANFLNYSVSNGIV